MKKCTQKKMENHLNSYESLTIRIRLLSIANIDYRVNLPISIHTKAILFSHDSNYLISYEMAKSYLNQRATKLSSQNLRR